MMYICAWHKMYFPQEVAPTWGDGGEISHGICKRCHAVASGQLAMVNTTVQAIKKAVANAKTGV